MFLKQSFAKKEPRKFGYRPFLYREGDSENGGDGRRIKFARLRQRTSVSRRSVRSMILLAGLVLVFVIYFWQVIKQETRVYKIDDIKIEDTSAGQ